MKYIFIVIYLFNAFCGYSQQNQPVNRSEVESLKKQEAELWYVDTLPPPSKNAKLDSLGQLINTQDSTKINKEIEREEISEALNIPEGLLMTLKWLLYGSLLVGLLFLVLKGNFSFKFKPINSNVPTVITESSLIENEEQLKNITYQEQIKKAETQQNYRLATRLYYLWTLKKLIESNLITFHIKKTNKDYCQELLRNQHYSQFVRCTDFYNYVWFGEFNINEEIYTDLKTNFNQLLEQL